MTENYLDFLELIDDVNIYAATRSTGQVEEGPPGFSITIIDDGREASDEITVLVNQAGRYTALTRSTIDHENAIGAYPTKGILGTQLGPNEDGTKGPWPSWRGR